MKRPATAFLAPAAAGAGHAHGYVSAELAKDGAWALCACVDAKPR